MGREIAMRAKLFGWAVTALVLAVLCTVLLILTMVGFGLIVLWVGIPWLLVVFLVMRPIAAIHRRRAGTLLGRDIGSPYLRRGKGNPILRLRSWLTDPATWRDIAWVCLNGTAGVAIAAVAIVEAVLDLLFWWLPPGMMLRVHAYLAAALLSPNERTTLARRVQDLADSRAATLDSSAAELRRIERDLHDGAQARLVAAGISLGLAEQQVAENPEGAKQLIAEARHATSTALSDLRDLVHGIHPPALADHGLIGAIDELCLTAPIPVHVHAPTVPTLPAPVESAAYFAVAEAIANIIKHGRASKASISVEQGIEALRIEVTDDGRGGAAVVPGGGLDGIARRLASFDGTMTVSSPRGGPTVLVLVIPTAGQRSGPMPERSPGGTPSPA